jgi:hypothetical protein
LKIARAPPGVRVVVLHTFISGALPCNGGVLEKIMGSNRKRGNPLLSLEMGISEMKKWLTLVHLTIRVVARTVGKFS